MFGRCFTSDSADYGSPLTAGCQGGCKSHDLLYGSLTIDKAPVMTGMTSLRILCSLTEAHLEDC